MDTKPLIRPAEREDIPAVAVLNAQVQALHREARPDYFKAAAPHAVVSWLRDAVRDPEVELWIAERDGVALGYLLMMIRERAGNPFCHSRRWCEIDQIAVDGDHRGQGIGRALMDHAISDARRRAVDTIELNVWAFNERAHTMFEKLGFRARSLTLELVERTAQE